MVAAAGGRTGATSNWRVKQRRVDVRHVSDDQTVRLSIPRDSPALVYEFGHVPADRRSTSGRQRRATWWRVARSLIDRSATSPGAADAV